MNTTLHPIKDPSLLNALTALSRSINIISTYGSKHRAFEQTSEATFVAMQSLFVDRKKICIGAFKGTLMIDESPVLVAGTLLKTLERRLDDLGITGLRISHGTSKAELTELARLLANKNGPDFKGEITKAGLEHIASEEVQFLPVHEGQTVANEKTNDYNGIVVINDDAAGAGNGGDGSSNANVHVEQIVAFLQGNLDIEDGEVAEELMELASDPAKLGQMILESVAIRQTASALAGESLSDVILGCLRRTYNGLRKQPTFHTTEGVIDLKKSLLLLEDNLLKKIGDITGDANLELDRQIVQTIREMNEDLDFEIAANQYIACNDGLEKNRKKLQDYVCAKGMDVAEELISHTAFPPRAWHRIVVNHQPLAGGGPLPPAGDGFNALAMVLAKIEHLMASNQIDGNLGSDLLEQAKNRVDDTAESANEKLESLSQKLSGSEAGTIGGHTKGMSLNELLSSIAELAQELFQPLTAITTSHEMILGGYAGEISNEQRSMIDLAHNSGEHLTYLLKKLIEIVGCPSNTGIDERFHVTSEEVLLMNKNLK
ncbi:MAG: hypothetical protein ABFR47_09485 [Verrucomicrobiota bacterium]